MTVLHRPADAMATILGMLPDLASHTHLLLLLLLPAVLLPDSCPWGVSTGRSCRRSRSSPETLAWAKPRLEPQAISYSRAATQPFMPC
jgi:hypothetical protein